MPEYQFGFRDNPAVAGVRHPNLEGRRFKDGYSVMSLFCGCGGMDLGFLGGFRYLGDEYRALPFNILSAIDIDERSIQTYRLNISDHGTVGDLTQIGASELPKARVLIGGFPCQDFSSSGPKLGFAGDRGQLYEVLVRYMAHHKPEMVIGENVPHLASLHGGQYLKAIVEDFEGAGYNFAVWNLFAPDYGLSQSRRRLFLVGVRKDLGMPPGPPKPTHSSRHRPIEEAIGDLLPITDETVANQSQYFVATKATAGGGQGDHTNKRGGTRLLHSGQRKGQNPVPLRTGAPAYGSGMRAPPVFPRRVRLPVLRDERDAPNWKCSPVHPRAPRRIDRRRPPSSP